MDKDFIAYNDWHLTSQKAPAHNRNLKMASFNPKLYVRLPLTGKNESETSNVNVFHSTGCLFQLQDHSTKFKAIRTWVRTI